MTAWVHLKPRSTTIIPSMRFIVYHLLYVHRREKNQPTIFATCLAIRLNEWPIFDSFCSKVSLNFILIEQLSIPSDVIDCRVSQ